VFESTTDKIKFLADMHRQISSAYDLSKDPYYCERSEPNNALAFAVFSCFDFADVNKLDLLKIINEKVEYNKHRADHKRENRSKEGGKKY
jgi:hypothetical protein